MDFLIAHPQLFWFPHVVLALFVLGQLSAIVLYGARNPFEPWWPQVVLMAVLIVLPFHGVFPPEVRLPVSAPQRDWADALALVAVACGVAMPMVRWCVARSLRRAASAAARSAARELD